MPFLRAYGRWAVWPALFLVPLVCAFLYSLVPPNPDQMELNYAGWRMLEGERPYVDFISCNWPGTLWMHMGAIAAFGNTLPAWRIADALLMLATVAGVGWFFKSAFDSLTAGIVVVFYPVLFYAGGWLTGQRDFVAMHLMLLAAAFHWKAWTSANWRWQIATGLCIASAALIKPPYLLTLPALWLHAWVMNKSQPQVSEVRRKQVAAQIVTIGLVFLGALAVLIVERVPLDKFWEVAIQFHLQAYSRAKIPVAERLAKIASWVVGPWWWVSLLAAASPLWLVVTGKTRSMSRAAYLVLPLFLAVALASAVWQGKGLMYHASGIYVCLSLLALITVAALVRLVLAGPPLLRIAAFALCGCFLLGMASRVRTYYLPPGEYLAGRISAENYYSRFTAGEMTVWEALSFVKTIRRAGAQAKDADKTVLVWGLANMINNESGYRNATRFHTAPVLLLAKPPFPLAAEWRRLFIADVERARPFACVISYDPLQDPGDEAVQYVRRLVRERYRPVASTEKATLYLRRDLD